MSEHEPKPVAWMHPKAKWADADYDKVRVHCLNNGPLPEPLYHASDITALQEEVAAAEARANAAEQRLKDAVKVLEPFAARAGKLDGIWKDHETNWSPAFGGTVVTIGHLRAARAFIKEAGE